jgi:hypothetical protein
MIVDEVEVHSDRVQPEHLPRPITSTLDTWDQSTQIDYPFNASARGRRPGWNIPSIAVTSETVNTVRTSAATRFVAPTVPTRAGMLVDKTVSYQGYRPMPNMAQTIRTDSNVQISFSATVRTTPVFAPYFAIFRDGRKISQDYRSSGAPITGQAGSNDFLISGAYVDTNAPMGFHTYDLRWKIDPTLGSGTITAGQKNRTFQASNLRAQ